MKNLKEILDPIKDFYSMRYKKKNEVILFTIVPTVIGIAFLVLDYFLYTKRDFSLDSFVGDLINQLITMLTLFISFSMAYLSIIITSSSKNVDRLKESVSMDYQLKRSKKGCTLYQVIVCEITYSLAIEILFLLLIFFQKFVMYLSCDAIIKIVIAIDITLLVHVLLVMMITVKDIYYSFWKSE